ncbi:MAG: heavy metal-binding domain-containing protein [Acidobacteriaceae bacterium]
MKDPVCGMAVNPDKAAAKAGFANQDFYFCSQGCAAKFREHPEKYLTGEKPQAAAAPASDADYACPRHPEVRQKGPGSSPSCGMALESETLPASHGQTEYTCPMHPEMVRSEPGNCPICGMALRLRNVKL